MPKGERKKAVKQIEEQIPEIKSAIGGTTAEAQGQLPGAKERASTAYDAASGAAAGLDDTGANLAAGKEFGTANPYATSLAGGTANPYATNLAITGGISEDEAQAMETAATRGVRSVYDVLGAEAQRKKAITGGYGGAGEISQMARQAGQASAEAGTDARARIAGIRQGGRVSGAGMVGEQQISGSAQIGDLMKTGAGLSSQGRIAGAQLLTQQYGLAQDQANYIMDYILKAQATGIQLTQQDIAMMVEISKQKGTFGAIAEGIGQIGGAVGGILGGIGGLGGGGGGGSVVV